MIPITHFISISEDEIEESFVRASGPGGQHVNTTSSAVQLRFDADRSPNLPEDVRRRLRAIAGHRMTRNGEIIITADAHRSQARNRAEALDRLLDLLRQAVRRPAIRRATKPTAASKERRLASKSRRASIKDARRPPRD